MLYKIASLLAATAAVELNEITDDFQQDAHEIWDSFMEKEEDVFDWFEIDNSTIKSVNGGTIHFLNVTTLNWLDETKQVGPNGNSLWTHHVAINIPKNLKYPGIANALVTDKCNEHDASLPDAREENMLVSDELAHLSQMITITIFQIPNCHIVYPSDPSQMSRHEDAVIAWAWRQFHEDPSNFEWLPRLPMAKASFLVMKAA